MEESTWLQAKTLQEQLNIAKYRIYNLSDEQVLDLIIRSKVKAKEKDIIVSPKLKNLNDRWSNNINNINSLVNETLETTREIFDIPNDNSFANEGRFAQNMKEKKISNGNTPEVMKIFTRWVDNINKLENKDKQAHIQIFKNYIDDTEKGIQCKNGTADHLSVLNGKALILLTQDIVMRSSNEAIEKMNPRYVNEGKAHINLETETDEMLFSTNNNSQKRYINHFKDYFSKNVSEVINMKAKEITDLKTDIPDVESIATMCFPEEMSKEVQNQKKSYFAKKHEYLEQQYGINIHKLLDDDFNWSDDKLNSNSLKASNINLIKNLPENEFSFNKAEKIDLHTIVLRKKHIDLNVQNNDGKTALHLALECEKLDTANYLIEHPDMNVNIRDNDGKAAIHYAFDKGNSNAINNLIKHKDTDLNAQDSLGNSILHYAVYGGDSSIIQNILDKENTHVNLQDEYGRTALHLALTLKNKLGAADCIIKHKDTDVNIKDKVNITAIHKAFDNCHFDFVNNLIKRKDTDLNAKGLFGDSILHRAVCHGDSSMIQNILDQKNTNINVQNNKGRTALHSALINKKLDAADCLIKHPDMNVNIKDEDGETILHLALKLKSNNKSLDLAKNILDKKNINVNAQNEYGNSILHYSAYYGDSTIAEKILNKRNINVNVKNNKGDTALHYALDNDLMHCAYQLVLRKDFNINAQNNEGKTALHLTLQHNRLDSADYLIKRPDIDINIRDKNGKTAIHHAFDNSHFDLVNNLIEHSDINLNTEDNTGKTPLHYALELDKIAIAKILVDKRDENFSESSENIANSNTAFDISLRKGYIKIARKLCKGEEQQELLDKLGGATTPFEIIVRNKQRNIENKLLETNNISEGDHSNLQNARRQVEEQHRQVNWRDSVKPMRYAYSALAIGTTVGAITTIATSQYAHEKGIISGTGVGVSIAILGLVATSCAIANQTTSHAVANNMRTYRQTKDEHRSLA